MSYELCGIFVNFGKYVGHNSMSSPHQKSGANTFFFFFFFPSSICMLLSSPLCFFFLLRPEFFALSFLFLFSAFSFFLSTPIWVVLCVYGFYLFIYLEFVGFMGEFVVVLVV